MEEAKFKIGDRVWLKTYKVWASVMEVRGFLGEVFYKLREDGDELSGYICPEIGLESESEHEEGVPA